jgi:hypothetical protein
MFATRYISKNKRNVDAKDKIAPKKAHFKRWKEEDN